MILNELIKSIQHKEVAFFIGSELSDTTSLLVPTKLSLLLLERLRTNQNFDNRIKVERDEFHKIAQYYENQFGRHALVTHLREVFTSGQLLPNSLHQLATSLPINTIFTTSYDDLLEKALQQVEKPYNVIVDESELAFWRDDVVQIVKLFGDLKRPQSLVITQRDLNTYFSTHARLAERLRTLLESKTALFLGYSVNDPFFNQIWDRIGLDFGNLRRWAYVVLFDADALMINDLHQRGIHFINLETKGREQADILTEWLQELLVQVNSSSKAETSLSSGIEYEAKGEGESPGTQPEYGTGNRWAVLAGVNEYQDALNYGKLQVCAKDVHTICHQLVNGGFEQERIHLLTDDSDELPTRENIFVTLKSVADNTEPDDLLLFYYSGHGDEDGGESYLVARNGRRLVLSDTAVAVSRIKEIMKEAPARAKVIILDACHSGVDIGGKGPKPMSEEFIRQVFEQAEGMAILASCKQGQLSYEWRQQERSVFTHFLLEALSGQADRDEKKFVTVQDTNRHVTHGVKLWASQHKVSQTPTLQYTVAGDIILCKYT